jgi:lipopolysaccharide biosynthesis regulator YciM
VDSIYLYFVVLAVISAVWWIGYSAGKKSVKANPSEWIPSLDVLLNHASDLPIKRLTDAENLDTDSLDLLVALGASFREKGEVDRAIRLHQTLFARADIPLGKLQEIELELAKDFIFSGLHDRAERLLKELLIAKGPVLDAALASLVELYEDEADWRAILQLAKTRKSNTRDNIQVRFAQAACELAELSAVEGDFYETQRLCRQALKLDASCARSQVVLGRMAATNGELNESVRCYLKALELDAWVLLAIMDDLVEVFSNLGDRKGLRMYLERYFRETGYLPALQACTQLDQSLAWRDDSIAHLLQQVKSAPSYDGVVLLIQTWKSQQQEPEIAGSLLIEAYDILEFIHAQEPRLICRHCGFKARDFHWRCPSCKHWATQAPYIRGQFSSASTLDSL